MDNNYMDDKLRDIDARLQEALDEVRLALSPEDRFRLDVLLDWKYSQGKRDGSVATLEEIEGSLQSLDIL